MDYTLTLINSLLENLVTPCIIAFGSALVYIIKTRMDKVSKSQIAKDELEAMTKKNDMRSQILDTIDKQVKSAVAANMQFAEAMKATGNKLTDEQAEQLKQSAKAMVINSLPPSLTEEGGELLTMIGSREKLDSIITTSIEKYVYEYKLQEAIANAKNKIETQGSQTSDVKEEKSERTKEEGT